MRIHQTGRIDAEPLDGDAGVGAAAARHGRRRAMRDVEDEGGGIAGMMGRAEEHKRLVRRLVEGAVNGGDLGAVDAVVGGSAPDAPDAPAWHGGVEGLKALLASYRAAVPDARWIIREQIAEGDAVVTRFTACGTQRGALWGLPPTGRSTEVDGILISRCAGGRIVAQWAQADLLGLLQQLGVMPSLGLEGAAVVARALRSGTPARGDGEAARGE